MNIKKIDIVDPDKKAALQNFVKDCIEDTKFLEKLKIDLSHRFDFTIPDMFDIISGRSNSDTIDLEDMYRFLLMIGTTAPVQKPSGTSSKTYFNLKTGPYPEPPITPDATGYFMSRIMAPVEQLPESMHVDYSKF